MLDETQQQSIVTRLNRIEGQIRGIRRMVQEPRLCVEILQQLSAAEAALNRISLAVFKFHVERCVPDGITLRRAGKDQAADRARRYLRSVREVMADLEVGAAGASCAKLRGRLKERP